MSEAASSAPALGPVLRHALTRRALDAAFNRVNANQGCAGLDGQTTADFGVLLDSNLRELQRQVLTQTYRPAPVLRAWLPRPGKKPRPLAIPVVRDRVLQTAVADALTPLVEAELESCSFAYRRGRGVRQAVERIQQLQRAGYRWVVDADIEGFFEHIDHETLLQRIASVAKESRLLDLLRAWLTAPLSDSGRLVAIDRGIAQGSPVSPLLANLYLDTLDDALLDANHMLVRYADDFLVLSRSKERAEHALELTTQVLNRLHLRLNPIKSRIVHLDQGLQFLGWNFVRTLAIPATVKHLDEVEPPPAPPAVAVSLVNAGTAINSDAKPNADLGSADAETAADAGGDDEQSDLPTADDLEAPPDLPALAPLQRTLYLVDLEARMTCAASRLRVERAGQVVLEVPAINVDQVLLFGPVAVTTQALHLLLRAGASLAYLTRHGHFIGRLEGSNEGSLVLAQAQHRCVNDAQFGLAVARRLVQAKIVHSANVLASYLRRHESARQPTASVPRDMREFVRRSESAQSLESLRGFEGAAASLYWQCWAAMVDPVWHFSGRKPRPAPDPVNALLSFGYSLLYQCVAGLLQARGLDARLGGLHVAKGTHLALASDLMEPWRALIVDSAVWNLVLNGGVTPEEFRTGSTHCKISTQARRSLIRAFEDRMNATRTVLDDGGNATETLDMRRLIDRDVRHYIAALRTADPKSFAATVLR